MFAEIRRQVVKALQRIDSLYGADFAKLEARVLFHEREKADGRLRRL